MKTEMTVANMLLSLDNMCCQVSAKMNVIESQKFPDKYELAYIKGMYEGLSAYQRAASTGFQGGTTLFPAE